MTKYKLHVDEATYDPFPAPDERQAGLLREAWERDYDTLPMAADALIKALDGSCDYPLCPSRHEEEALDCVAAAKARVRAALALAQVPAPRSMYDDIAATYGGVARVPARPEGEVPCSHPFDRQYRRDERIVCDACGHVEERLTYRALPAQEEPLDVERLTEALRRSIFRGQRDNFASIAEKVAAEYRALGAVPEGESEP